MNDKKLDQMLKNALTQNIRDDEVKIRFETEDIFMKKQRNYIKPVVALAACAALVIGSVYTNVPERIMNNNFLSADRNTSEGEKKDAGKNSFAIKVKAAEVKKLEKGKETAVISHKEEDGGAGWTGTVDTNEVGYLLESPIICEGKNIDTITYSLNHGYFNVIQPEDEPYVLSGTEYIDKRKKDCEISVEPDSKIKTVKKSYSSFTISAKSQQKAVMYLCDNKKVPDSVYDKIWNIDRDDEKNLDGLVKAMNHVLDNLTMTCKITYKDGTSDSVDIAVKEKVMTYKEAYDGKGGKKIKELLDQKSEFTTFELK